MICPECGKTGLQVSEMQAGLEGAYDYANLITKVGITCQRCNAVFETKNVNTLGLRRVKRGTTTTSANSTTASSAKPAEKSGPSSPSTTSPIPWSERDFYCPCAKKMVPHDYPCEVCA